MNILLTGGTGLIGSALCRYWHLQGHQLTVWSRTPERVASLCGEHVRGIARLDELTDGSLDAIVNLAGAPIADRPWTKKRRALLLDSRVRLTDDLVAWLKQQASPARILISGSAVGWYGDCGDRELREESAPADGAGTDFASQLCVAWEQSAIAAESLGIRVVVVRTGLVLASRGGLLERLRGPFSLGLGGPIGNGQQWMPWIHLDDQVQLIDFLLHSSDARGAYNACAPNPVRNAEFTKALGRAMHRPAFVPMPAFALRMGLGDLSGLLLGGQRTIPQRLLDSGFKFGYRELDAALADLLRVAR